MPQKKSVQDYLTEHEQWQEVLVALTDIIHSTELVETIKWGMPTYMINKKNVITLGAFKNHVSLWFIQGVFLEDPYKKLVNAQEGRTKAMRHWRFTKIEDVEEAIVKAYIEEAIQNQKEGKELKPSSSPKAKKPLLIPPLLQTVFDENKEVKECFDLLKLTQKRNLCNFINQAKQLKTKERRIERIIPLILAGKGIYD